MNGWVVTLNQEDGRRYFWIGYNSGEDRWAIGIEDAYVFPHQGPASEVAYLALTGVRRGMVRIMRKE